MVCSRHRAHDDAVGGDPRPGRRPSPLGLRSRGQHGCAVIVGAGNDTDDSSQAGAPNVAGIRSWNLSGTRELPDTTAISGHCGRGEGKRSANYGDDQDAGSACAHWGGVLSSNGCYRGPTPLRSVHVMHKSHVRTRSRTGRYLCGVPTEPIFTDYLKCDIRRCARAFAGPARPSSVPRLLIRDPQDRFWSVITPLAREHDTELRLLGGAPVSRRDGDPVAARASCASSRAPTDTSVGRCRGIARRTVEPAAADELADLAVHDIQNGGYRST